MSTLSTNPVDSALNFMPESASAGSAHKSDSLFARIIGLLEAVSSGLAAMHRYEALRARGMAPSEAAAKVHAEFFGN